jgi:hypothetical protein
VILHRRVHDPPGAEGRPLGRQIPETPAESPDSEQRPRLVPEAD